jgi:hypothetical protein
VEPGSASVADQRSTSVSSLIAFESPERVTRPGRRGSVNPHHRGTPARRFAVVTCMDARLDPAKLLGLDEESKEPRRIAWR